MKIKELRKQKGLTLQELADMIGVSNQTVSNWENEKTEPDIKSLVRLASIFSCTIDYLILGDPETNKTILDDKEVNEMVDNLEKVIRTLKK